METYRRLNVFTICLNGLPWITMHHARLESLKIPWNWTIVHGIADPKADTAWCNPLETVAHDETLGYLRRLRDRDNRVTLIEQERWHGKKTMCNAALETFKEQGMLLQMDADEVWSERQLQLMPSLFEAYPEADCAFFLARVWVGPNRYTCQPGGWANRDYEWLRLWKWEPGRFFETHEPPRLAGQNKVIKKTHTAMLGLVFDHYSYVFRDQIAFKEKYYGKLWSVAAWESLQTMRGPVELKAVLPFVDSETMSFEL